MMRRSGGRLIYLIVLILLLLTTSTSVSNVEVNLQQVKILWLRFHLHRLYKAGIKKRQEKI
jgi:hypothetical protein